MSEINILIVEDEAIVALEIKKAILKIGFNVTDIVGNYINALQSIKNNKPNLILVDINLKNSKDGISIVESIQEVNIIPIIYLTAYSDDNTIQRAMFTNPLAYLVKPFKREDLKSAIFLAIYKLQNQKKIDVTLKSIGYSYFYDLENRNLFFKNYPIKLSSKEKALLEILIDAKGTIVPFRILEDYIWMGNPVSDSALRTLLYRLRAKIEYRLIQTIPSFGCKLLTSPLL